MTSMLRSRRSALIYRATLVRVGIEVRYQPDGDTVEVNEWSRSGHGIQDVLQQWLKRQYYRLYVLPVYS